MSNVNVRRLVENIRSGTNVYTPLVELVVNAIQAIDQKGVKNGLIQIEILRSGQADIIDRLEDIDGFIVKDNGVGFTKSNRDSFDTLYTEQKIADGGKGFGRFTCLKYFNYVKVASTFAVDDAFHDRSFRMGLDKDIIVEEETSASEKRETGTAVEISGIKSVKFPDKRLDTVSRVIVERLLPYFVDKERACPRILIREASEPSGGVSLNDYLGKDNSQIVEMRVEQGTFTLPANEEAKDFQVRVFKFYAPRSAKSKVSLVAHRREVTDNPLQAYIPEFAEEFYEAGPDQDLSKGRNFVVKSYVFGDYLNDNVSLERGEFRFQTDNDLLSGISQSEIEQKAAEIAQSALGSEITERKRRKQARIADYVSADAPWHRTLANEVDFDALPMRPSNQDIELHLQKKKYEKEIQTRSQVAALLKSENPDELGEKIIQLMDSISDTSKNDLIHYVSMRKCVLDLFSKSLEIDADGKHKSEGDVHDIIMRRKKDSEDLDYDAHNLWMLDERLNFSSYVSSDKPLNRANGDRTDITIYNRRVAFRGENEASNPITIFEFKKPQRDNFADPSSKEDPIQQIVRYVNQIRDGKFKTPTGRDIIVNGTTPFYGYVVCDLTAKVRKWLEFEKDFTPMPDGLGWFRWFGNNSLYMEVLSWTKLLRDAEMRNKIFFNKLGID
ncbi:ATP-binding protein [Ancylobacter sp. Lp-2]|uniref:ATP-binding protein n=1 Tax=Ancylobacter TaxID=99 RepID=UPI001E5D2ECA|nr:MULTISPECIES: ATP-binding protein [Ancylobacter]MCB4767094.1 ATP-binding protein [Ancylobacter sp. Lp-2]MCJ8141719.1 ATP-binding protein [Ancylobacter gelatini]